MKTPLHVTKLDKTIWNRSNRQEITMPRNSMIGDLSINLNTTAHPCMIPMITLTGSTCQCAAYSKTEA